MMIPLEDFSDVTLAIEDTDVAMFCFFTQAKTTKVTQSRDYIRNAIHGNSNNKQTMQSKKKL